MPKTDPTAGGVFAFEQVLVLRLAGSQPELVARRVQAVARAAPDLLLIPNPVDFHHDHATVALACLSVPRPATLIYEIWGPCRADVVLPLSPALAEAKRRALDCYETQLAQVDYHAVMGFIQGFRARHLEEGRFPAAECYQWVLGTGA